jgi:hypothetical protein
MRSPRLLAAGLAVGTAIAFGWFATGWLADDEFDAVRVSSLTFVAPLGDAILYIATFSGARLNFGIGSVAGVVAGSFSAAILARGFRWEACDDARELKRHMTGALLMGIGAPHVDGMHDRPGIDRVLDARSFGADDDAGDCLRSSTRARVHDDRRVVASSAQAIRHVTEQS